ncbi:MAG: hypothetical protein AB7V77_04350 [Candidatus Woesearchaeota archaeon]
MIPTRYISPYFIGVELFVTIFIIFLCILIYFKTKEVFDLTKHKGIFYFRNTFLFLAISYFLRLIMVLIRLNSLPPMHSNIYFLITSIIISYISTMAILLLFLSTTWKYFNSKYTLIFTNILALLISLFAFLTHEPQIVAFIQLILFLSTIIFSIISHKKLKNKNKFSNILIIYFLLFLFWFTSMLPLGKKYIIPFEYIIPFQILSLIIFFIIYFKVKKWTK